ncbi:Zinc finger protein [Plakobranchus ocellatus]|uniref:Zinc finger protein n=1 Tax=Plakobranchus ocellatus TaxID=259542 RepID=A0AAV3YG77_9GAST|nr:Zinc finger protein [Plakobranchus ocellatus]
MLTVRPTQCVLGARTIDFFDHRLGDGAIGPQVENVEKVRAAPRPKTRKKVRVFLGLWRIHLTQFVLMETDLRYGDQQRTKRNERLTISNKVYR